MSGKKRANKHGRGATRRIRGIECPRCGSRIWSRHVHDLRHCRCSYCYIDGGREYLKYGWGPGEDIPKRIYIRIPLEELE